MSLSKRDHIIEKATELFDRCGFHAPGIDTIQAYTGVSKKTLYHHFRSKEELILAVLRHKDSVQRNQFARQIMASGETAEDRILGLWPLLGDWFADPTFHGCIFSAAMREFPESDDPIYQICHEYKSLTHKFITSLCVETQSKTPHELADQIFLLMEGAIATATSQKNRQPAETAQKMVKNLLALHA